MRRAGLALALGIAACVSGEVLLSGEVFAQQPPQPQPQRVRPVPRKKAPETPPPAPKPAPVVITPQEKPLVELSEIIGALTFLAQICSPASTPNPWRVRMETLLDSEGEASGVRDKMTGAFNLGFAEYATTYRQCTDSARAARRILTRDAARLARDLERRFGS